MWWHREKNVACRRRRHHHSFILKYKKTIINGAARSTALLSLLVDRCRFLATSLIMARAKKRTSKCMMATMEATEGKTHPTRAHGPKRQWQPQQVLPVRKIDHNLIYSKEKNGKI
jgi:hypothetical protein